MKYKIILSVIIIVLAFSFSHVLTDVPQYISYQGKLTDPSGALIDDTLSITFTFYDSSSGGNVLWTETQPTVVVEYGVFNVLLGSVNLIPDTAFNGDVRYLGVKVGANSEMTPRKEIVSVGYSYRSAVADSVVGGGGGGDDGDWTISGDDIYSTVIGNVGIGTTTPAEKLDVDGNIVATGKATIGPGHTNTGNYAFVAGENNQANNNYTTVGGGASNQAAGNYSAIGGGQNNSTGGYYNAIAGGGNNRTAGLSSSIAGGSNNRSAGDYSFTVGYADTILADYSYLFGINSNLNQDSTFMVDMPYIRFGDETNGYEFPTADGNTDQVMATDGNGQLSWTDVAGGDDGDWTISGDDIYSAVSGRVGIGTSSPVAKLEVSSVMRLTPSDSPGSCNDTTKGSIYYDGSRNEPCFCNGTDWVQMDGGGSCVNVCTDVDGDGYDTCDPSDPDDTDGQLADCDDSEEFIYPGATEECDSVDNDCDEVVDEGCECFVPGDCPQPDSTPVCNVPSTCQGYHIEATCVDNICDSTSVDDDRGCGAGLIANNCGYYLPVYCTGGMNQTPPPPCPTSCSDDSECDANAHCDGTCEADLPAGSSCDEDSDCISGSCVGGLCQ